MTGNNESVSGLTSNIIVNEGGSGREPAWVPRGLVLVASVGIHHLGETNAAGRVIQNSIRPSRRVLLVTR